MAFVKGINRKVIVGEETTFGTISAAAGQYLRRVNAVLQLNKDIYQSQEILLSQQTEDQRHGVRRAIGSFDGQLSPGAYKDFMQGMLRGNFAAGATASSLTVDSVAGPPGTITRAAGDWIADGFRVGDIVRFTGFSAPGTANNDRNYRVQALTATVMTVSGVGDEVVAAVTSDSGVTATVVGKKLFTAASGQLIKSYTIESFYPDADPTAMSERFVGMRIQQMAFNLPATGLLTVNTQMIGQTMQTGTTQYFSSPTAATTDDSLAAVNGKVRLNGTDVAVITGAQFTVASGMDANPVIGSNFVPDIFPGTLTCQGSMSIYLQNADIRDLFLDESEVDLWFYLTSTSAINSPFISFVMNRVKLNSAAQNDSDRAIIQQVAFQALRVRNGTTNLDQSTISVQDSSL